MNLKKLFPLLILLFVISVVGLYFLQKRPNQQPVNPNSNNVDETSLMAIPENWVSHSYPAYNIEFYAPPEAQISESSPSLRIVYMGEKQRASGRTQTELSDGFIIAVTPITLEDNQNLEQYANFQAEQNKNSCPVESIITDLDQGLVGETLSYVYSIRGCRNDVDQYYVYHSDKPYEVSLMYTGFTSEDATAHKSMAETVLGTIKPL